jgi:hypothetical protein
MGYDLSVSSFDVPQNNPNSEALLQPKSRKISLRANRLTDLRSRNCSFLETFDTLILVVFEGGAKARAGNCSKPE